MSNQNNQKPINGKKNVRSGMKTIIGFDSWTQGASHFLRLYPELKRRGYRLLLIHLGSWGHDTGRPKEELFDEMVVRDISYYKGKSFSSILDEENPRCVIFLSTRAIAHQAFNRWALFKNIPTCHLYHGLTRSVSKSVLYYKTNYLQHLKMIRKRIAVNFFKIIPVYLHSLLATRADRKTWSGFLVYMLEKTTSRKFTNTSYIVDTKTSIGCVYLESEKAHMVENYEIPAGSIFVVGNPDLMKFGIQSSDMGSQCIGDYGRKTIIYIDTALSKSGLAFSSDDDFIRHLVLTYEALKAQGYVLLVKLHPAHRRSSVPMKIKAKGINLCEDMDFVSTLKSSKAVIAEPSSAALIPALLGLPLLLAQYHKLSGVQWGDMFTSYPRARNLENIDQISLILEEEKSILSPENVMSWISANAGPMPAEDMPQRVATAVSSIINANQKQLANF
jgi:hypothetical protein